MGAVLILIGDWFIVDLAALWLPLDLIAPPGRGSVLPSECWAGDRKTKI
jgi:hypothetical protein